MSQRVAYGALAIAVLTLAFMLDITIAQACSTRFDNALGDLFSRGSIIPLVFSLVAVAATLELGRFLRSTSAQPQMGFACLMVAALMLSPWLSSAGWLGSSPAVVEGLYWQVFLLAFAVVGAAVLVVFRRTPEGALRDLGATCIPIFYIGFLASFAVQFRCGRDIPADDGAWLLLIILLTTKASDIGAYFVGSTIGRRKLAPVLSPGKSIEGAIGGLIASGLAGAALTLVATDKGWVASLSDYAASDRQSLAAWAFVLGVLLSISGQIGDLVESGFKRDAGTKDSGDVLPRFGGILDLIDSPVLALPVAWFLLTGVLSVV